MAQLTIQQAFELALQHHRAARLPEAEQLYRQILALQPNHADALHFLGVIAYQAERHDVAADLIRRAIALRPDYAEAHSNLGKVLKDKRQFDQAVVACRHAIALRPHHAAPHHDLGDALNAGGQVDEAIAEYRQAIACNPSLPESHNNLGNLLRDKGQLDEAIAAYRQSIACNPNYAQSHSNLGTALTEKGQLDEAIAACRQAIVCNPALPEAHYNLANALRDSGQLDAAIAAYRQAIFLRPASAETHSNLGGVLRSTGQLEEAIAACHQAITLKPNYAEAHNNLANALKDAGRLDEAVAAYRQAIAIDFGNAVIDSNLLYMLHFHPAYDAAALAEEHRRWNDRHAGPLRKLIAHPNERDPRRRLRVGYVSPDFRDHIVGVSLLSPFLQHDRRQFHITCYSNVRRTDALRSQFQQNADCWRNIVGLSDEEAAQQIRADQIDILVDLTLHMADNRLLIFARKPAPVQATWLGYPSTTGLTTIDYRLSDPFLDPPGADPPYVEKTLRLPHTYICWRWSGAEAQPSPLPMLANGYVTFGSLNNFCKVGPDVLAVWARILRAVPNSRLMLRCPLGDSSDRVRAHFASHGIAPERLELSAKVPRADYEEQIRRLDICLDPFPYCGHTTSCDAMWMGVPVVTLAGATAVGRGGVSLLSNLGLPELIAADTEQYVRIATSLAGDVKRLGELRCMLRQRMQQSPLMDAPKFARNIEAAYRQMWHNWCTTASMS